MPRSDKSSYTDKQKRQVEHIEEGYPAGSSTQTHQQDQSGVPGLPGSKAGPAVKAPSK
jgi:hypothetical protein